MLDILLEAWKRPGADFSPIYKLKLPSYDTEAEISRLHKLGVNALLIYTKCSKLQSDVISGVLDAAKRRYMLVYTDESCVCADTGYTDAVLTNVMPLFSERLLVSQSLKNSAYDEPVSIFSDKGKAPFNICAETGRIDILNPDAVESFLYGTFDKFFDKYKSYIGTTFAGIVTDRLETFMNGENIRWSYDLEREFYSSGGDDRMLLSLVNPSEDKRLNKEAKRIYSIALASRVERSFTVPLSKRCIRHNIDLCGKIPYSLLSSSGRHFTLPIISPSNLPKDATGSGSTYIKAVSDVSRHNGGKGAIVEISALSPEKAVTDSCIAAVSSAAKVILPNVFFNEKSLASIKASPSDIKSLCEFISRHFTLNSACRVLPDSCCAVLTDDGFIPFSGSRKLSALGVEYNFISKEQFMDHAHIHDENIHIDKYAYNTLFVDPRIRLNAAEVLKIGKFAANGGKLYRGSSFDSYAKKSVKNISNTLPADIEYMTTLKSGVRFTHFLNRNEDSLDISHPAESGRRSYLLNAKDGSVSVMLSSGQEYSFNIPALSSAVIFTAPEKADGLPNVEKIKKFEISEIISLSLGENTISRTHSEDEIAVLTIDRVEGSYCYIKTDNETIKLIHRPFCIRLPNDAKSIELKSDGKLIGAQLEIWHKI